MLLLLDSFKKTPPKTLKTISKHLSSRTKKILLHNYNCLGLNYRIETPLSKDLVNAKLTPAVVKQMYNTPSSNHTLPAALSPSTSFMAIDFNQWTKPHIYGDGFSSPGHDVKFHPNTSFHPNTIYNTTVNSD